jgi:hypothetical protein
MSNQRRHGGWAPNEKTADTNKTRADYVDVNLVGEQQFATRERINDFVRLMRALPDLDPPYSEK